MRTLIAALALASLTACSNGSTDKEAERETQELPKVSTATSCGQLFDGSAPIERVVDLMAADASSSDAAKAEDLADELDPIREQAAGEVGPHVEVVESELREYADVKPGESFETGTMVTSLTELNNVCGVTPRF